MGNTSHYNSFIQTPYDFSFVPIALMFFLDNPTYYSEFFVPISPQAALAHDTRLTWVFHPLRNLNSSIYTLLCSIIWKPPLSISEVLYFLLKRRWSDEHDLHLATFSVSLLVSNGKCFSQKISYTSIIISWMLITGRPDPNYWAIESESRMKCLCGWT